MIKPIEQSPTLRDQVQEQMREAIITGEFKPGERLVERPLCERMGVSRTVVRETIRFLEAEGLVEILPNRGPIVATLDWDRARQIYDIRRKLESAAAADCAELADAAARRRISKAHDALQKATINEQSVVLLQKTTAFYAELFSSAGHDVAWEVVQRLNARISRLRLMTLSASGRKVPGPAHMQDIHDAIVAGDASAARKAVQRHISDAAKVARKLLNTPEH